jgi:hypothetical protein
MKSVLMAVNPQAVEDRIQQARHNKEQITIFRKSMRLISKKLKAPGS